MPVQRPRFELAAPRAASRTRRSLGGSGRWILLALLPGCAEPLLLEEILPGGVEYYALLGLKDSIPLRVSPLLSRHESGLLPRGAGEEVVLVGYAAEALPADPPLGGEPLRLPQPCEPTLPAAAAWTLEGSEARPRAGPLPALTASWSCGAVEDFYLEAHQPSTGPRIKLSGEGCQRGVDLDACAGAAHYLLRFDGTQACFAEGPCVGSPASTDAPPEVTCGDCGYWVRPASAHAGFDVRLATVVIGRDRIVPIYSTTTNPAPRSGFGFLRQLVATAEEVWVTSFRGAFTVEGCAGVPMALHRFDHELRAVGTSTLPACALIAAVEARRYLVATAEGGVLRLSIHEADGRRAVVRTSTLPALWAAPEVVALHAAFRQIYVVVRERPFGGHYELWVAPVDLSRGPRPLGLEARVPRRDGRQPWALLDLDESLWVLDEKADDLFPLSPEGEPGAPVHLEDLHGFRLMKLGHDLFVPSANGAIFTAREGLVGALHELPAGPMAMADLPDLVEGTIVVASASLEQEPSVYLSRFSWVTRRFLPGQQRIAAGIPGDLVKQDHALWLALPWTGEFARITNARAP